MPPNDFLCMICCVLNQTIIANIACRKSYPRNILVAFIVLIITFMFKIFIFAHFFVDLQSIRPKFENYNQGDMEDTFSFLYSKNDIYGLFTEKGLHQNVKKTLIWEIRPDCGPLRQKSRKIEPRH